MINNDDEFLKDGERLRVPIPLMDAAPGGNPLMLHRPGYAQLSDAQQARRVVAYAVHDQRKTEAWLGDKLVAKINISDCATAYDAHDAWLANAWRGAR